MKWYYVENGKQAGPVEETEFPALFRDRRMMDDTLVWSEGMPNWLPFKQACPELFKAMAGFVPSGQDAVCSECGNIFSKADMIAHGSALVCANCKPVFLQKLSEGGGSYRAASPGSLNEEQLLARDYTVDIGDYFTRAWEMFKANPGGVIGTSFLVYLVFGVVNFVPYLNVILGIFFSGPLMGGLWNFYLKSARKQAATVGDGFSGFGPRYWQLVLTQLIPTLITFAMMGCIGLVFALAIPAMSAAQRSGGGAVSGVGTAFVIFGIILTLVAVVVLTYLTVCWMFALPLVMDKRRKFWPALQLSRQIVNKHWWHTLALLLVASLFAGLGFLACGVGVLVTGPIAFGMWAYHYEKVFGDLAPNA